MEMLEFVLLLLAAVLVSAVLDQVTPRVSLPLVQIALGAVIILLVGTPVDVAIDPELFLVLFIAPLLFDESRHASKRGARGTTRGPSCPLQLAWYSPRFWWSVSC